MKYNTEQLLNDWKSGDAQARERLADLMYEELRGRAVSLLRNQWSNPSLQATELVNECFLKLFTLNRIDWQDKAHLQAMASTIMHQILIDHYRRGKAGKRDHQPVTLVTEKVGGQLTELSFEPLEQALSSLAEDAPDYARVVEMKFFGGMTHEEIGVVLGVSDRTVKRYWRAARAWLEIELSGT